MPFPNDGELLVLTNFQTNTDLFTFKRNDLWGYSLQLLSVYRNRELCLLAIEGLKPEVEFNCMYFFQP